MLKKIKYSKDAIKVLELTESIRSRPGMYLGKVNEKGFVYTLKAILRNSFVYAESGYVVISLLGNLLGKLEFKNIKNPVIDIWNRKDLTSYAALDIMTLNALCKEFKIIFLDNSNEKITEQNFKKGKLSDGKLIETINYSNVEIKFELDKKIWGKDFEWNEMFITHQIREFAYLYKGVKFEIKYLIDNEKCKTIYHFKNGLKDRLNIEKLNGLGKCYFETVIDKKIDFFEIEAVFAFREYSVDEPYLRSYVNDMYTHEDGSHVDGILQGLINGIMRYLQKYGLTSKFKVTEKGLREKLIVTLNIKLDEPIFSGSTRNKLTKIEIVEPIADCISEVLYRKMEEDEKSAESLIREFEK